MEDVTEGFLHLPLLWQAEFSHENVFFSNKPH
jgi:hypothetical protein